MWSRGWLVVSVLVLVLAVAAVISSLTARAPRSAPWTSAGRAALWISLSMALHLFDGGQSADRRLVRVAVMVGLLAPLTIDALRRWLAAPTDSRPTDHASADQPNRRP
jgi:4-amino-4-deoxy-L-arabinose transferase-like glycosyltransferase